MGEERSAKPSNRSSESIAATNALSQSEGPGDGAAYQHLISGGTQTISPQ